MPWLVALALIEDGWYLRKDIIWSKPNPMPESVTDRPTSSHSYIFLLSKRPRYFYDAEAVRERTGHEATPEEYAAADGRRHFHEDDLGKGMSQRNPAYRVMTNPSDRNLRSVWTIPTQPYPGAHFATFPEKLVERCLLAGTSARGCCPECGAPWVREVERTAMVTRLSGRREALGGERFYAGRTAASGTMLHPPSSETVGWHPTCDCGGFEGQPNPIPCTVLDPFAGTGTVGLVAQRHSRRAVLIDLNPDYLAQCMKRTAQSPLGLT